MYATNMFRSIGRFTPLVGFSLLNKHYENDVDLINQPVPQSPKTGWERVKKMYTKDEYDKVSLEMENVLQSTMTGAFVGVVVGGIVASKSAYLNFIENNQATIFKSTAEAKKKLQDYVTVSFAKGGVRWGWRLAMFTGIFSLTATTISVYRGNTSIVEYISAGVMAGGIYKMHLGLAATFVGAGLGAVLGGIFGSIIVTLLKISGASMDDIRRALNKLNEHRVDQYKQAIDKQSDIKNDILTKHHDQLVQDKGVTTLEDVPTVKCEKVAPP